MAMDGSSTRQETTMLASLRITRDTDLESFITHQEISKKAFSKMVSSKGLFRNFDFLIQISKFYSKIT